MQFRGTVSVNEIPEPTGRKPVNADTLAVLPVAEALTDGQALVIDVDDKNQAARMYNALKVRHFKVTTRGLTIYVSKNGASE